MKQWWHGFQKLYKISCLSPFYELNVLYLCYCVNASENLENTIHTEFSQNPFREFKERSILNHIAKKLLARKFSKNCLSDKALLSSKSLVISFFLYI